jgi:hypothetical protein
MASSGQTGTQAAQPVQSLFMTSTISCYPQSEKPSSPLFRGNEGHQHIQEIIIKTIMRVPVDFNPAVSSGL